jgi:hypothetical protein
MTTSTSAHLSSATHAVEPHPQLHSLTPKQLTKELKSSPISSTVHSPATLSLSPEPSGSTTPKDIKSTNLGEVNRRIEELKRKLVEKQKSKAKEPKT